MEQNRKGEKGPIPYRTGRFFSADSMWYFASREGIDHGPFPSRTLAVDALKRYLESCLQVENRLQGFNT
ncbi:MAG: DUF6316 family protein [Gammaproteobacteria bacterium]|nr:DUF6316 family protein [Gammaproteobacteria bacterium]MDH5651656.1 DUF6316 family protein [Gammaproteobacteria bacterium]